MSKEIEALKAEIVRLKREVNAAEYEAWERNGVSAWKDSWYPYPEVEEL